MPMFGLSKKERTAEALRLGTLASTTGGFLHPTDIEKLGLNNDAASWLYSESIAHQINALRVACSTAPSGKEFWVTPIFFKMAVHENLTGAARSNGLPPNAYFFALVRMQLFQEFGLDQVAQGAHYLMSA